VTRHFGHYNGYYIEHLTQIINNSPLLLRVTQIQITDKYFQVMRTSITRSCTVSSGKSSTATKSG